MNYELNKENQKILFPRFYPYSYFQIPNSSRGFTLIELMVSITIFIIVTGIVMTNQSTFRGSILITNLAYDIALSVRQAQTFGISVKQNYLGNFDKSYGIHFGAPGFYILFADTNANGVYDLGDSGSGCVPNSECVNFWRLERGNLISRVCAGAVCTDTPDGNNIDSLDVIFTRPDPEPRIIPFKGGTALSPVTSAMISVVSPRGAEKTITVRSSGQISVQ